MPMFSIIVPIYKAERYLNSCVESILKQTNDDFELILVNDGSPDRCLQICDEYDVKDKRVTVIHKKNGGVSSARNAGINIAKGEYVIFVDSDDQVAPNMLSIFESSINQNRDLDYLVSGLSMRTYNNETLVDTINYEMKSRIYNLKTLFEALNIEYPLICISGPCSKLYRKSILNKYDIRFDEEMTLGEDGYFNLCYLEHCNKIVALSNICYFYLRRNKESLFSSYHKDCLEVHEKVYDKMRELIIKNNCSENSRYRFEQMYYNMLVSCISKDFQNPGKGNKISRMKTIEKVINNKYIIQNINNLKITGIKHSLIKKMISYGNANLIYLLFRVYYHTYFI